jgi:general secretion pathway protein A
MNKVTPISKIMPIALGSLPGAGTPAANETIAAKHLRLDKSLLQELNLETNPFPVVPDFNAIFMTNQVDIILSEVAHMIHRRRGFMVVTGEVGLGKTTIARRLLHDLSAGGIQTALIFNTFMQGADLIAELNKDFGLQVADKGLSAQMAALNAFLLDQNSQGQNCAIIIDEAQQLTIESLELIRQVSNLETDTDKLVQILLVGQPELEEKLASHEIRQLKSRISLFRRMTQYNLDEVKQYVAFKMQSAGGESRLKLTDAAYTLLSNLSAGNPRKINMIMDRCLYVAVAYNTRVISRSLLQSMADETELAPAKNKNIYFRRIGYGVFIGILLLVFAQALIGLPSGISPSPVSESSQAQQAIAKPVKTAPAKEPTIVVASPVESVPSGISPSSSPKSLQPQQNLAKPVEGAPAKEPTIVVAPQVAVVPVAPAPVEKGVPEPTLAFLNAYGLERYSGKFQQAYEGNSFKAIGELITQETGLRLIMLKVAPDGIRDRYKLLSYGKYSLLFWKPQIQTASYRMGYQGEEIANIQKLLAKGGFYRDRVDGMVGVNSRMAMALFQQSVGLEPTGIPDLTTLFILEHQNR